MNRILLHHDEISPDGNAVVCDARAQHIINVLKAEPGQSIKTGVINGLIGTSTVVNLNKQLGRVNLKCSHTIPSPSAWCDLILAVPRPKVMKRLWAQLAALGVRRIALINAFKVEKFYFDSHVITAEFYTDLLLEGLQQSGTSLLPEVTVHRSFKFFVEHELDRLFEPQCRFLAHPTTENSSILSSLPSSPVLAIGPEGGWTDHETEALLNKSFTPFSMGKRILRTDTACIAAIARLGGIFDKN